MGALYSSEFFPGDGSDHNAASAEAENRKFYFNPLICLSDVLLKQRYSIVKHDQYMKNVVFWDVAL
jgi:hypothetical protein